MVVGFYLPSRVFDNVTTTNDDDDKDDTLYRIHVPAEFVCVSVGGLTRWVPCIHFNACVRNAQDLH